MCVCGCECVCGCVLRAQSQALTCNPSSACRCAGSSPASPRAPRSPDARFCRETCALGHPPTLAGGSLEGPLSHLPVR